MISLGSANQKTASGDCNTSGEDYARAGTDSGRPTWSALS